MHDFYSLRQHALAFDDQNITDIPTTSDYTHEQESEMLSSGVGLIPQMVSVRSRKQSQMNPMDKPLQVRGEAQPLLKFNYPTK